MNEQVYSKTISRLAMDYAQEVYDHYLFEMKANEQTKHMEGVLNDKDKEIEQLKMELQAIKKQLKQDGNNVIIEEE